MKVFTRITVLSLLLAWAAVASATIPTPVGVWQFDSDLSNDVAGSSATLAFRGDANTKSSYQADTINGMAATVLQGLNYSQNTGLNLIAALAPNGGTTATRINQWSAVYDIKIIQQGGGFICFQDTLHGSVAGDAQAEGFWRDSDKRWGFSTYFDQGVSATGTWYRIAWTADATKDEFRVYKDGEFLGVVPLGHSVYTGHGDGRLALSAAPTTPTLLVMGNETQTLGLGQWRLNSFAFFDQVLTPDEIEQLGGPSADGIPASLPLRDKELVINSPMWYQDIFNFPPRLPDLTQRWSVDGTCAGCGFSYVAYDGIGSLKLGLKSINHSYPWIEVNTSPTLPVDNSPLEVLVSTKPVFDATKSMQAVTFMISDASPDASGKDHQYFNAEALVRLGNSTGTLAVFGTGDSVDFGLPEVLSGVTASTITDFDVVFTYHDDAYYAYYFVNGEEDGHLVPGYPLAKPRTKSTLRITNQNFYNPTVGYGPITLSIDKIRIYSGFDTVPVELSDFMLD